MKFKGVIFGWDNTLYSQEHKIIYPYTKQVLNNLKKDFTIGLVSDTKGRESLEEGLTEIINNLKEPFEYFNSIIVDKHRSMIHYLEIMRNLEIHPSETMVVDSSESVIEAVQGAGCYTTHISRNPRVTIKPTYRVKDITPLPIILRY